MNGSEISFFENVTDVRNGRKIPITKLLENIKNGKWKDKVTRIRSIDDDKERKKEKERILPCTTISGVFSERRNAKLDKHSERICIDMDNLDNAENARKNLKADPYTYALFTSASGRGRLAVIVKINPEKHLESFLGLEKYYLDNYGYKIDKSCKNVSRARYVSYDPDLFVNPESKVFEDYIIESGRKGKTKQADSVSNAELVSQVEHIVQQVEERKIVLGDDSHAEWLRICFALVDGLGEAGIEYFHRVSSFSQKYNQEKCDKQYNYCLKENEPEEKITISTFFHYAKEAGLETTIPKTKEGVIDDKSKTPTQAEIILERTECLALFHDENDDAYAFLNNEVMLLRSKKMKQWLSRILYQATGKAANSETLNNVIGVLEGKAIYDNPEKKLFNRVANAYDVFWYDLGNGKSVKITINGWSIVDAPILFRRYSHQQAQAIPKGGGDPWKIFKFLNINNEHRLLVLTNIISCFIPDIPHPICHPHGAQGSGKTTLCKVTKKICDPSSIETLITPRDVTQLVQVLAHHHLCLFDNMSDLPVWMSDILAQACTGGGFSKRQLYTDDEDIIYKVKRCIGLNGINLVISKPDLMDRSILLHLERIDPAKRIDEEELWKDFEKAKPEILGGIFDVLTKAMSIYPEVKLDRLPRMADFGKWGYGIAEALGEKGDEFLQAYQKNVERQNEEVIQGNTLAQTVLTFMTDKESWDGTVKGAWGKLNETADPDKNDSTFPKTNRTLRKHLNRIKTNLMDLGITFKISARTKEGYPITFQKSKEFASLSTPNDNLLSNKDLTGESKVNQNVDNKFASPFSSPPKSLQSKELKQSEANVSNSNTYWDDLNEVEI